MRAYKTGTGGNSCSCSQWWDSVTSSGGGGGTGRAGLLAAGPCPAGVHHSVASPHQGSHVQGSAQGPHPGCPFWENLASLAPATASTSSNCGCRARVAVTKPGPHPILLPCSKCITLFFRKSIAFSLLGTDNHCM